MKRIVATFIGVMALVAAGPLTAAQASDLPKPSKVKQVLITLSEAAAATGYAGALSPDFKGTCTKDRKTTWCGRTFVGDLPDVAYPAGSTITVAKHRSFAKKVYSAALQHPDDGWQILSSEGASFVEYTASSTSSKRPVVVISLRQGSTLVQAACSATTTGIDPAALLSCARAEMRAQLATIENMKQNLQG